jgi:formiminoglutamate deiminase
MYELAGKLDPDSIYSISKFAYAELAMAGVTAVGEFHYVHHQPDGTPYGDRTVLAEAVIRAARDVGVRIALLRVVYNRAGSGRAPEGVQRRFCDATLDDALGDVQQVRDRFEGDPHVSVGVAPHSVRAVPRPWLAPAAAFAREHHMPFHMHVAEQRRELEECIAEHGAPPIRMLAEDGVLDERFGGVHATHLEADEVAALGAARAFVCVCRTTERDLGDGLCNAAALVGAGVRLCTGVDSHAISDPFEEARSIELDDRSRSEQRHVAAEADALFDAASVAGYEAIGLGGCHAADGVVLDATDPALVGADDALLTDHVIFSASPRSVIEVRVGDELIVEDGVHRDYDAIRADYERVLDQLIS